MACSSLGDGLFEVRPIPRPWLFAVLVISRCWSQPCREGLPFVSDWEFIKTIRAQWAEQWKKALSAVQRKFAPRWPYPRGEGTS
jgi:hypothetical protein